MSAHTHDDAFHEIQLNGKQLVFLFMAATVVSVVIFLCGVLVGRGVQAEQVTPSDTFVLTGGPAAASEEALTTAPAAALNAESDPRAADAPPAVDDLSYFSRLEQNAPPAESLRAVPQAAPRRADPAPPTRTPPADPPAAPRAAAAERPAPASQAARATTTTSTPPANAAAPRGTPGDWAVQVAALNARPEAEAVATRLSAKGYAAYVVTPGDGTPSVFRVRIGPFRTRRDADNMAARLEKEEQFKPWVTR